MEKLRKELVDSTELFPVKGSQPRRTVNPVPMPSPNTVITISSSESSPSGVSALASSHRSDDNDDVQSHSPTKKVVKRLVWSDDEDDLPFISHQQPKSDELKPDKDTVTFKPVVPFPKENPKSRDERFMTSINLSSSDDDVQDKPALPVYGSRMGQNGFTKQPTVIKIPANSALDNRQPSDGPLWETFDEPAVDHLYDPRKTAAEAERDLKELLSSSMNDGTVNIDMQDTIVEGFQEDIKLLPHQVIGRKWMAERESGKKAGGILADDMGLGKTIQTLTRIVDGRPRKSDRDAGYAASTLVVCPVALVSQWASEIRKMTVGLRVIEHHGPSRAKDPEMLKKAHIVITSYSVLSSEHGTYQQSGSSKAAKKSRDISSPDEGSTSDGAITRRAPRKTKVMDALFRVKWWRIVLDEAHNIKNVKTKGAEACCALEGKFRWALTGTPMQNSVEELYSLFKFLRIRPLNDWETFNNQINKPVKSGKSVRAMKKLQVVLKAIMLRRKKDTVLNGKQLIELPDRNVNIVHCAFGADEREFYESIAMKVESTLNKFRQSGDIAKNYTSVLVLLLRLRQACNHASLLSKDFLLDKDSVEPRPSKDLEVEDELADIFKQMNVSSSAKCHMCQQPIGSSRTEGTSSTRYCSDCEAIAGKARRKSLTPGEKSLPPDSAKIRMILQLLRNVRDNSPGEKTIIFSQFTSMLDIIQPFLRNEGLRFVRYDGSMRKDQREESLRAIREDSHVTVILISFKAGNTGLNLTACNNVILVDLWWNPALEDQAFDRTHRFGQTRAVNIYKLTIEQTVEERILALQEKKRALAAAALSGDRLKNSRLGLEELMALFRTGDQDEEDED